MRKKKTHYLHVSYRVQFDAFSFIDSDRFFKLKSCTIRELCQSLKNTVEKENQKEVKTLMLISVTELSEDTFNMLMKDETFVDIDTSEKEDEE